MHRKLRRRHITFGGNALPLAAALLSNVANSEGDNGLSAERDVRYANWPSGSVTRGTWSAVE